MGFRIDLEKIPANIYDIITMIEAEEQERLEREAKNGRL